MSKIEWCDITLNWFTGCENGCPYCYARRFATRLAGKRGTVYHRLKEEKGRSPFTPAVHLDKLDESLEKLKRARTPRRVFLGSMSDLAHDGDWIATGAVGWVQYSAKALQGLVHKFVSELEQHTFLMLTKRPEDLRVGTWPQNVHLGVSATNDREAEERLDSLHWADCGVRWISLEPLVEANFDPEKLKLAEWVVIGAMTGSLASSFACPAETAWQICLWCLDHDVPCFVKDNLQKQAPEYPWPTDLPGAKRSGAKRRSRAGAQEVEER